MARPPSQHPTELELEILKVLWRDGPAPVRHVRDALAHFKTPQWVSFVEALPKTATGKIQKYLLRGAKAAITRQ